jgi:adenine-specific DNA-methyltransferase
MNTPAMQKIAINDPMARSADIVAENLEYLQTIFPDAFTDGTIDFDVLRLLLGGAVDEREEKYGLNWHGKRRARQLALTTSGGTLRPAPQDSMHWDTTQNLMIEGDNLEVLKLLQKSYAGKVKMIYIDPPYNTGNDFVYPDNFADSIKNYLALTGQTDGGLKTRSNPESHGRFHTEWLNMMYPRIKLARSLLRPDGLMFISIDDSESKHLSSICDELFGEENHIGTVARKTKLTSNKGRHFAPSHEYVMAYAKDAGTLPELNDPEAQEDDDYIKLFRFTDAVGQYNEVSLYMPSLDARANQRYFIECPDGSYVIPPGTTMPGSRKDGAAAVPVPSDKVWRWTFHTFTKNRLDGRVVFKRTETSPLLDENGGKSKWNIYTKIYLHERQEAGLRPSTLFDKYPNSAASKLLIKLKIPFDFSKPFELILWLMKISNVANDDVVLDFFAGSGTTGHAVMEYNRDGGKRRYILVQLPECLDPENKAQKTASDFCDSVNKPRNIAELTKERLRRSAEKVRNENPMFQGDLGFRVFKLDSSNISAWAPDGEQLEKTLLAHESHLKADRTEVDVLFELLLKLGLDLCVPIEKRSVSGKDVYSVAGGVLFACLALQLERDDVEGVAQGIIAWRNSLAPVGETTCVFRDAAFADDVTKSNLAAILSQHGVTNVRSL